MEKTVVELFAGVGGFRVGLNDIKSFDDNGKAIENRDWKFVWVNQWEPSTKAQYAYECYKTRFGGECINEDINKIDKNTIPNHALLVGGFPCQDYSVARSLSNEKGIEGKKGVLFWDIADVLKKKHTPFALLENVDRLLKSPSKQRGRDFGIMLRTFYDLGYNVEWRVINAADYGATQRRRRVFIFAWKNDTKYNSNIIKYSQHDIVCKAGLFAHNFPIRINQDKVKKFNCDLKPYKDTVEMTNNYKGNFQNSGCLIDGVIYSVNTEPIIEEAITLGDIRMDEGDFSKYILTGDRLNKFNYLRGSKKIERTKPNGDKYFYSEGSMSSFDSLDLPGRTMLTSEGSVNRSTHIIPDKKTGKLRILTPIEAERLQHFPDNWTNTGMPERSRYFMMGNALVTYIINRLEKSLSQIVSNE